MKLQRWATCVEYKLRISGLEIFQSLQCSFELLLKPPKNRSKFSIFNSWLLLKLLDAKLGPSWVFVSLVSPCWPRSCYFYIENEQLLKKSQGWTLYLTALGQWGTSNKKMISSICSRFFHMFSSTLWGGWLSASCITKLSPDTTLKWKEISRSS